MKRTFYTTYRFFLLFCALFAGNSYAQPRLISTVAGNGTTTSPSPYTGDGGAATAAVFASSWGVASDGMGNLYITDLSGGRARKINSAGVISRFAGTIGGGASGDGGAATAAVMNSPYGIAADGVGNVFICDYANQRIRKVNAAGVISTYAGGGSATTEGINATSAKLNGPQNVSLDAAGNLYIVCGAEYRIRKVSPSGIITTVAGTGVSASSPDGAIATASPILATLATVTDAAGNVYFADGGSKIRKVNTSGILSTVAGTGIAGYTGDGGQATAADISAYAVEMDQAGNLYFTDLSNKRVRMINTAGIISTIAGDGTVVFGGENVPATASGFNFPTDMAVDGQGNLYVMDWFGYRLTRITAANTPPYFTGGHNQTASLCSGTLSLDALLAANDINTGQAETWSLVSGPAHGTATVTYGTTSTGTTMIPTGLSYTPTFGYTGTDVIQVSVVDTGGIADTTTITITVGAAVSAGVITGPSAVCLGSTINLTDAVSGGVWSVSNGNITITPSGLVTGMTVGTTTVSYSVTGTCGTSVAKGTVTVVDMPGAVNGPTVVCTGATIVLTDAVGGGFWSSASSTIATAGPTSGIVFGVTAGTATISYTIGGVCAATSVITVDPPLPAIKGPGKVCVGAMITLSDSVTAGTWSETSGYVSVNPSTGDVYGMTAGTGIITYSVSSGCMALRAFTVNPNPSPIVLTSAVMCYSDMGMYATDADAGGTWTSALVTVSTGGYLTAYAIGSGLITYTLPTGCLTTTPITVNPLPALITGPKNICTGELTALADATFGGTWSTTEATILVDIYSGGLYGVSAGTAVVTYQLPTTCYVTDTITVSQSPTAILGSPNVCIGNLTTLSDAVPGGTWSISAGGLASISPLGTVLGIMAGAATVTYTTGSGCTATVPVTIWPLPSLFTVTGGGSYCTGGTGVTISLTGSVPGTKYYLFNGSTLIDSLMGTGSFLTYGLRTLPGFYTVYAVNTTTQCGNLMSGSALITIDPILTPAVSITTVPGDTVCLGGSITFVAGAANGGTAPGYQWKVNGVPAGTGGISFTYVPTDGDLIGIELTSNATCVDPITAYAFRTVGVVTPVVPVITLTADPGLSVAEGTTVTYTATVTNKVTAASYQWLKNGTAVSGANSPVFVDNDVRNFDTVSCRVWSGGFCSQSAIERLHMNVYKNDSGNNNTAVHNVTGADASIRVIPNPSKGVFTVTGTMTEEAVTLELTDMIGRMIYKGEAITKNGRLNAEVQLSSIANGTYLLNVRSGAMHKVFHIIIEQ